MIGEPLDGKRAAQILCQQTKRLCLLKMAQRVHLPFGIIAVRGKDARQLVAPRLPIGLGEKNARVEQLVKKDGVARQIIGGPARRTHQMREARQQRRMFDE